MRKQVVTPSAEQCRAALVSELHNVCTIRNVTGGKRGINGFLERDGRLIYFTYLHGRQSSFAAVFNGSFTLKTVKNRSDKIGGANVYSDFAHLRETVVKMFVS